MVPVGALRDVGVRDAAPREEAGADEVEPLVGGEEPVTLAEDDGVDDDPVLVDEAEPGQARWRTGSPNATTGASSSRPPWAIRSVIASTLWCSSRMCTPALMSTRLPVATELVAVVLGPVGIQEPVDAQVRHQHQPSHADSLPEVAPAGEVATPARA